MTVHLSPLRAEAVATTVDTMYAADPGLDQRFGAAGRTRCEADLHHHLDYLQAALDADDPGVFARYVAWLAGVLDARGVPRHHLVTSIALLDRYLTAALPPAEAALVHRVVSSIGGDAVAPAVAPGPAVARYARAALDGDHRSVTGVVDEAMARGGYAAAAVGLVQPALYEIGHLWQRNRVTVAQEHLATAISQRALSRAYLYATFAPPSGRAVVLACVPGNYHSLGLRIVADMLEMSGWEATFLGRNVPTADLVKLLDARRPELLAISVALPTQLSATRALVAELRAELGQARPQVWVGGLATLGAGDLWRTTGADGWASDAAQAVEQT